MLTMTFTAFTAQRVDKGHIMKTDVLEVLHECLQALQPDSGEVANLHHDDPGQLRSTIRCTINSQPIEQAIQSRLCGVVITGADLLASVQKQGGWSDAQIWGAAERLVEDGTVLFDVEEDEWSLGKGLSVAPLINALWAIYHHAYDPETSREDLEADFGRMRDIAHKAITKAEGGE